MNLFGILVVWLGALIAIPYAAFSVFDEKEGEEGKGLQLQAAGIALNFVLLHGLTKILNVFIPTYVSAVIEAVLMGIIHYNSPSGTYSTGVLETFRNAALMFVWPFFIFETWQVAKVVWGFPEMVKRIYENSSGSDRDSDGRHSSYWCDQMEESSKSTICYSVFEFIFIILCFCLCLVSIWLHLIAYGPTSSVLTKAVGYAIITVEVATVILGFKAGNGMFIGAIFNASFVSFNLYRGHLHYNLTYKSWKTIFTGFISELKSCFSPQQNSPVQIHDNIMDTTALVTSITLAGLVIFIFVAEFLANENAFADEENGEKEVDSEMAKLEGNYADYLIKSKTRELEIALIQYLIEGALMMSYAGIVFALWKNAGPGYYARFLQSVVLLGTFMKRICGKLGVFHEKLD